VSIDKSRGNSNTLENLNNEAGGLRLQRIPPTERRGRVHTSTVTVAVINPDIVTGDAYTRRGDNDFRIEWFSGTGCGGQHKNKHQNSCRIIHIPTGIAEARQTRSRENSQSEAMAAILRRLDNELERDKLCSTATIRRDQVGTGMRADKIRTIRFQDDQVVDHRNGRRITADRFMKGYMNELW